MKKLIAAVLTLVMLLSIAVLPASAEGKLAPILRNPVLFGLDLNGIGLAARVEQMFGEMLAGPGAVRRTLKKYL